MIEGATIEFKRDAAPDGSSPLPWKLAGVTPVVADIRDRHGARVSERILLDAAAYIVTAANERPAMLAEIDRLRAEVERMRQAVVDACEACARRFDAKAAGYRAMQSRLLGERQFLEADDAGKAAEDIEAIAAAIRARSTP